MNEVTRAFRKLTRAGKLWLGVGALAVLVGGVLLSVAACETMEGAKADINHTAAQIPTPNLTLESPSTPVHHEPVTFKGEPDIRVRIAKGVTTKELSGPVRLLVRPIAPAPGKGQVLQSPLTVTTGPQGLLILDGKGARHEWPAGTDVEVSPSEVGDGAATVVQSIRLDKQKYPGFLTIKGNWGKASTRFDVIASMPIEAYLPGVVTGELLKDWPRQTNEAQAVAARTYALFERARARSENRPVDVENTTSDQVFGSATSPVATEAVRATRGMVLVSEGKLIRAYFSSQCGGRAASAADVWPNTEAYFFNRAKPLQGKPRPFYCQHAPLYRWEVTRSDDDVSRRLRAWGKSTTNDVANMGRLRSVEIADRNDAQRPNRYKLIDDRGREFMLKAEELRVGMNQTVDGLAPITKENRVNSGDVEVEVFANQVRVHGRGWGHGVGMCQWCAKGMAESGMDWHSMMLQFYPGVEIVKAY